MYGRSTTDSQKYNIYRSADLGKTWIEIETDFPGGRLLKGNDDSFYIVYYESDYTIKLYKSTDDCITWFLVENSRMNQNYIGPPYMEVNENDQIFIIYVKELPKIALPMFPFYGLDYFWVGQDIWTGRYVSYFFAFFLPAAAIGFIVAVVVFGLYSLYAWDKRNTEILRQKARESVG